MSHGLSISGSACAADTDPRAMKLVQPTDFDILAAFDEHGRNVAASLALHLGRDRSYRTNSPIAAAIASGSPYRTPRYPIAACVALNRPCMSATTTRLPVYS